MRAVLPQMHKQKSGLVMQISSGAGRVVFPCFGIYNASKFALEAMTEAYRYELAECGIDCVKPGAGRVQDRDFWKDRPRGRRCTASFVQRHGDGPRKNAQHGCEHRGDPNEVANAALEIAQTPFGKRQLRYRIGSAGRAWWR